MPLPCANPSCKHHLDRNSNTTGLCFACRGALYREAVPSCGYIPSGALTQLSKGLQQTLSPTPQDTKAALRLLRGSRHPVGDWDDRPIYSAPVVHTIPKVPLSRRMPEILVGRRRVPTVGNLLGAYTHFILAQHVIGLPPIPGYFLAGASFYGRRDLQRPTGQRREHRGKVVKNSYRLTFQEFVSVGRLVIKAAGMLGVHRGLDAEIVTSYLEGVEAGSYHPPVIVPATAQRTLASGDHPLDHKLDLTIDHAPQYRRMTRRASGLMHLTGEWPALLNRSIHEVQRDLKDRRDAAAEVYKIRTTTNLPSTDWLFD